MRLLRFAVAFSLLLTFLCCLTSCVDEDQGNGETRTLKIVCLGDSITYGYTLADPVHESYPARVRQQSHGRWHVLNLGVNGTTVLAKGDLPITAEKAYQRALSSEPDVIVLLLGTNDTKKNNWQYINEFVHDYTRLIHNLQGLSSKPHVIVCSIPPIFNDYPNGITAQHVEKINDLIKQAIVGTGSDYLDLYTPLSKEASFFVDGVHPNDRGAQEIASLVSKKIAGL